MDALFQNGIEVPNLGWIVGIKSLPTNSYALFLCVMLNVKTFQNRLFVDTFYDSDDWKITKKKNDLSLSSPS